MHRADQPILAGHFRCQKPGLQAWRILVVEDEALVASLFEDDLRSTGAEVIGPARSVDEALLLIAAAEGRLSAAVLDFNLNGTMVSPVADCLADLGVPFVFATGYGEGCDRGLHAAAPVLAKPFSLNRFVAAIRGLPVAR